MREGGHEVELELRGEGWGESPSTLVSNCMDSAHTLGVRVKIGGIVMG